MAGWRGEYWPPARRSPATKPADRCTPSQSTGIVSSRLGLQRKAPTYDAWFDFEIYMRDQTDISCVLVDEAQFLTPEQVKLVRERVDYDRSDATPDPLTMAKALRYATDLKLWAFALMFMCATMPSYAFSYFLPLILAGMGFSTKESQLLSSPPYVFAVIMGLCFANVADRANKRGPFIVFQALVTIVGLAMVAFTKGNAPRYTGVFLGVFGCQANIPAILAYQSNNIVGQSKRAFTSALVIGFGGIGGIVASVAFTEASAPAYRPGLWASIAFQVLMISMCGLTSAWFLHRNAQIRRGTSARPIEGVEGFLYTL